jgi:MFS family permease
MHLFLWFLVNAHAVPVAPASLVLLTLTSGMGWATFNLANARLVMATVPEMGRSHFFALYSVVSSLTLGIVPIVWGVILDALRNWHWEIGPFDVNNYSVLFFCLTLIMLFAQVLRVRLSEPRALTNEEFFQELLVKSPSRAMTRLLMRKHQSTP